MTCLDFEVKRSKVEDTTRRNVVKKELLEFWRSCFQTSGSQPFRRRAYRSTVYSFFWQKKRSEKIKREVKPDEIKRRNRCYICGAEVCCVVCDTATGNSTIIIAVVILVVVIVVAVVIAVFCIYIQRRGKKPPKGSYLSSGLYWVIIVIQSYCP